MFTLRIPVNLLAAADILAAKRDVRYYLKGVHFDAAANTLVSTDGSVAFIASPECVLRVSGDVRSFTMPSEFIALALAGAKQKRAKEIDVTVDGNALRTDTAVGQVIDGQFPNWRRIYPHSCTGEGAQFDKDLLARVTKANKLLGAKKPAMYDLIQSGKDAAIALLHADRAHVVVMPLRLTVGQVPPTFTRFGV